MTTIRNWLKSRTGRAVVSDATIALAAGAAVLAKSSNWNEAVLSAAGTAAVKALLRLVVPIPDKTKAVPAPSGATVTFRRYPDLSKLPTATGHKLGRNPKTYDSRDLKLKRYLPRTLTPPTSVNWASAVPAYPMCLNDTLGDCTIAGALHAVQTWADNTGNLFTPTDAQALALYESVCGYNPANPATDRGGVLRSVLAYWHKTGMAGHKVLAYVSVDPTDRDEVKTAIDLFGCVYVGLELPLSAQSQGVAWKKETGANATAGSWGGHCVIYTGYTSTHLHTVTWGQEGTATWGFHDAYCDEAWACVSPDWMNAAGVDPQGLDLTELESDLAAL